MTENKNVENIESVDTFRYDNIDISKTKLEETPEGYLQGWAVTTRTGVFNYMKADGSMQRELRLPEDVFHKDTIESFKLLPMTNDHPLERVNATNSKELTVGMTGEEIKRQDHLLLSKIKITDSNAIADVKSGKRGMSYGYSVNLVKQQGVYNGERYDYIQKNIKGNHVAIVNRPRAGREATIRLDSEKYTSIEDYKLDSNEAVCFDEGVDICITNIKNETNKINMETYKLDGKDYQIDKEIKNNIESLESRVDSLGGEVQSLQSKLDVLENEKECLQQKLDQANDPEAIHKKVQERFLLEKNAAEFIKNDDFSNLTNNDLKIKVIASVLPDFKSENKSDEVIDACYDIAISSNVKQNLAKNMQIANSNNDSSDSHVDLSNEALAKKLTTK